MNILVVGSKPEFTTTKVNYQIAYFANAAITRSDRFLATKKINVISHYLLNPKSDLALKASKIIAESKKDHSIVIGGQIPKKNAPEFTYLSSHLITKWTIKTIGIRQFIYQSFSKKHPLLIIKDLVKLAIKGYVSASKPSTGVATILYAYFSAIKEGEDFMIHVSGIGLKSDGYDYITGNHLRGHELIDKMILSNINKNRIVFFNMDDK